MVVIENTPEGLANAAMAHLFLGLMKSDGEVTVREEVRMDDLMERLSEKLPGEPDAVSELVTALTSDPDYSIWKPQNHLERGIQYFEAMVEIGDAYQGHIDAVIELLEELMKVDDTTEKELEYLQKVTKEFASRYA